MSRRVLISGSVAFDTIMVFDGHFKEHILPDRVHMLNVSFLTPRLKREAGGCAANIAYNLSLLGGEPAILAAVGEDGAAYVRELAARNIDVSQVKVLKDMYTPQAFITTDLSDNQITAFHPGAMAEAHQADGIAHEDSGGVLLGGCNGVFKIEDDGVGAEDFTVYDDIGRVARQKKH